MNCFCISWHLGTQKIMIVFIYIAITVISAVYSDEVLMEERTFCGDNIINTLQKFCREYYTPDHRAKRQVVDECCRSTCSTHHLMSNYCESYDKDEVIRYLKERKRQILNGEVPQMSAKRRRRRRRREVNTRIR